MEFLSKQKNRSISIISLLIPKSTVCFSSAIGFGETCLYTACGGLAGLKAGVAVPEIAGVLLIECSTLFVFAACFFGGAPFLLIGRDCFCYLKLDNIAGG